MTALVPAGPGANVQAVLASHEDAIHELQNPSGAIQMGHVATKAKLPPADDNRGGVLICDEINAAVHSTLKAGAYEWLRLDGSDL